MSIEATTSVEISSEIGRNVAITQTLKDGALGLHFVAIHYIFLYFFFSPPWPLTWTLPLSLGLASRASTTDDKTGTENEVHCWKMTPGARGLVGVFYQRA